MPNLTLQEASALAAKVNGPFTADAVSDLSFVEASLAGTVLRRTVVSKAPMPGLPRCNPGEFNAYLYVSHQ